MTDHWDHESPEYQELLDQARKERRERAFKATEDSMRGRYCECYRSLAKSERDDDAEHQPS